MVLMDSHPEYKWDPKDLEEVRFHKDQIRAYNSERDIPKFSEAIHGDMVTEEERDIITAPKPIQDPIHAIAAVNEMSSKQQLLYLTALSRRMGYDPNLAQKEEYQNDRELQMEGAHTPEGMVGYCPKDTGQAWYKEARRGISPADVKEGQLQDVYVEKMRAKKRRKC
mgnify:CR=1 FL=1